ncbi:hypothetical protein O1611_g9191 [Lasiodiplodia mahajangana]|uniref:Uncharacterized protein n=1 Tax=Lasiodiplodia mahajangana TaxID=1108764 RepID=A0ACC2JAR1_9PEZI|nr:hypothetical protein O1611_g9191 [Lasiodiplodia mahajangana]
MAGGPETNEAEIETSPPSYEESKPMPGTYPLLQQPGPVTRGNPYRESEQRCSLQFVFCPDPSDMSMNQDWAALLIVKCHDVPCLMREGFHWDGANVIREEGYIDCDFTYARRRQDRRRWANTRHYFLKDLQLPSRWVATIKVWGLNPGTTCQFDLNQLSRERSMQWAAATNQSGHSIYHWHYCSSILRFNAIYDNMPMEGWWPWPRNN